MTIPFGVRTLVDVFTWIKNHYDHTAALVDNNTDAI
jgi:hypothetical protein